MFAKQKKFKIVYIVFNVIVFLLVALAIAHLSGSQPLIPFDSHSKQPIPLLDQDVPPNINDQLLPQADINKYQSGKIPVTVGSDALPYENVGSEIFIPICWIWGGAVYLNVGTVQKEDGASKLVGAIYSLANTDTNQSIVLKGAQSYNRYDYIFPEQLEFDGKIYLVNNAQIFEESEGISPPDSNQEVGEVNGYKFYNTQVEGVMVVVAPERVGILLQIFIKEIEG